MPYNFTPTYCSTNTLTFYTPTYLMTNVTNLSYGTWTSQLVGPYQFQYVDTFVPQPRPVYSHEDFLERERLAQHAREQAALHQEKTRVARFRARSLLLEVLDDHQRREYDEHKRFHVRGSRGRRYCVVADDRVGVVANVNVVDEAGKVLAVLCAHPSGLPLEDSWTAQKLALECDEELFLATANVHRGAVPALVAA
jgi:hypothetical protein